MKINPELAKFQISPYPEAKAIEQVIGGTFEHPALVVLGTQNRKRMRRSGTPRLIEIEASMPEYGPGPAGLYEGDFNASFLLAKLTGVQRFTTALHEASHGLRSYFINYRSIYLPDENPDLTKDISGLGSDRLAVRCYDEGFAEWVEKHTVFSKLKQSGLLSEEEVRRKHTEVILDSLSNLSKMDEATYGTLSIYPIGHKLIDLLMTFLHPYFSTYESLRIVAQSEPESFDQMKQTVLFGKYPSFLKLPPGISTAEGVLRMSGF